MMALPPREHMDAAKTTCVSICASDSDPSNCLPFSSFDRDVCWCADVLSLLEFEVGILTETLGSPTEVRSHVFKLNLCGWEYRWEYGRVTGKCCRNKKECI